MTNTILMLPAMVPEAKYQVTVRGPVPVTLAQKMAEAHAKAIRESPVMEIDSKGTKPQRAYQESDPAQDAFSDN